MDTKKIITLVAVIIFLIFVFMVTKKADQTNNQILNNISSSSPAVSSEETQTSSSSAQLKIEDIKVGEGREVKSGDSVVINYTGTLENGTKFDSSLDRGQPFETKIGVGQVIQGWDQGVIGMKVGGKRRLTIPPEFGYGARGAGDKVPPNSTLIFEIELVDIK